MEILLAIDGGGTRTRCLAMDRRGVRVGEGQGGPSNHLQAGREVVARSLHEAAMSALQAAGADHVSVIAVSAGLAGVDYDGKGAEEAAGILSEIGFSKAVVNGDMVIAHQGALAGATGVVALAGTGASFLGIDAQGNRLKVGGWGPAFGDEGSAHWIARQALQAAGRAYDGTGKATTLLTALTAALGIDSFRQSIAKIYGRGLDQQNIAALCPVVCQVGESGDAVARSILAHAGEALARGAATAWRGLGLDARTSLISYHGAVLERCAFVRERFRLVLEREIPGLRVRAPRFEPVMGAYMLGCAQLGWNPQVAFEGER